MWQKSFRMPAAVSATAVGSHHVQHALIHNGFDADETAMSSLVTFYASWIVAICLATSCAWRRGFRYSR